MGAAADRDRRRRQRAQAPSNDARSVKERKVFGQAVASFQNTRYTLAELQTEVQVPACSSTAASSCSSSGRARHGDRVDGQYWTTDLECKVIDECLQLHGGYGYMWEVPIARLRRRARAAHLRRHQRDHEGSGRPVHGPALRVALGMDADGRRAKRPRGRPRKTAGRTRRGQTGGARGADDRGTAVPAPGFDATSTRHRRRRRHARGLAVLSLQEQGRAALRGDGGGMRAALARQGALTRRCRPAATLRRLVHSPTSTRCTDRDATSSR